MPGRLLATEEIVQLLGEGPLRIERAAGQLDDDALSLRSAPDVWSVSEILAHLRACQDMWGDVRIVRMLNEDHPIIRSVNPRTWIEQTDYRTLPFRQSLAAFTEQRERLLAQISALSLEQWARDGTFTGAGKPRTSNVHIEADALARHERTHIKQIERLCKQQSELT